MSTPLLRLVRPAPDPLGLYVRVGWADQPTLLSFITSGDAALSGVVIDAKRVLKQAELMAQALDHKLDAVLDPQTLAMATPYGYSESMDGLPWSAKRPHTRDDFKTVTQRRAIAKALAEFAVKHQFTQVMAPTHVLTGPDDPWLQIDVESAHELREALQNLGAGNVQVIYSLALPYDSFRTATKRVVILSKLYEVDADAIWLNVAGCGADGSATRITRYADAAADFHALQKPVVADHVGGLVGLALLAVGAVGGIAHGVTLGERFDTGNWFKPSSGTPFAPHTRVYFPTLDWHLQRVDAEKFFESGPRAKAHFGCTDSGCCPRGITSMLQQPGRHFLYQRTREVGGLSQIPESLRRQRFLEEHVRLASDRALLATKLNLPEALAAKAASQSVRLDNMRIELAAYVRKHRDATFARHPVTRAAREARG